MCNFQGSCEALVTKHIEDQHPEKHLPDRCPDDFPTISELKKDIINVQSVPPLAEQLLDTPKCKKCLEYFNGLFELKSHMKKVHILCDKCKRSTLLLGDSMSKYQNPRLIEKAMGGHGLFTPGCVNPRTSQANCSNKDWSNSCFLNNNLEEKVI